jgi:mycothiol synthase
VNRPLPDGYTRRPASRDDIDALAALWRRSDESLGVEPNSGETFLRWILTLPFLLLDRDSVVVEHGGAPAAFAVAIRDPASEGSAMEWFGMVDPAHLGRGVGGWLVTWADRVVEQRADERPFAVRSIGPARDAAAHELLAKAGYAPVRTSWDMAIDVRAGVAPPEPPDGVRVRTFQSGRDERTFWQVAEAAFAEHFGFAASPYESWEAAWYRSDSWDPSRVLLAEIDGDVVGELAWFDAGPDGYVASLGVLKLHRRRGIASFLLRAAFADIAAAGFQRSTLSVDTENETGALALYRSVGMEPIREDRVFQRGDG